MGDRSRWIWIRDLLHLRCPHARRNTFTDGHLGRNRLEFHRLFLVHPASAAGSRATDEDAGRRVALTPGRSVLLPAGRRYRFDFVPGFRLAGFHFRLETASGIDVLAGILDHRSWPDPTAAREGWDALALGGLGYWLQAEAILRRQLGRGADLDWDAVGEAISRTGAWGPVVARLSAAGAEGPDVAGLARGLGLSRERFSRRFRDRFHETPRDWHQRHLAARVTAGLLDGQRTLADLAGEFGFCDAFALSRFIKRATGLNPSRLRAQGGLTG
jgi:AraC-like DNA-binding protein